MEGGITYIQMKNVGFKKKLKWVSEEQRYHGVGSGGNAGGSVSGGGWVGLMSLAVSVSTGKK
jgi:hypothetical protein